MSPLALAPIVLVAIAGPESGRDDATAIELLVLDIEGVDLPGVERALALRLPLRDRVRVGDARARARDTLWGYVQVRPIERGWALALILADQRGYYREIEGGEGGDDARRVASTIANLIASVEEDDLPADEENVELPAFGAEKSPPPEPPPPEPRPEPPPERPPPTPSPPFDLGGYLGAAAVLNVGPPQPAGLAALGGSVGLQFRGARGLWLGLGYRGSTRAEGAYRIHRHRLAPRIGYSLRRGLFEGVVAVGPFFEPWRLRTDGASAPLLSDEGDRRGGAVLLGGLLRLAPGLRVPIRHRWSVRVAPVVELAGGSVVGPTSGIARVRDRSTAPPRTLFRAGGLELAAGLQVGVWWTP